MSERIVKLQSQQNYQEIAAVGAFVNKLADFVIPASGLTYDLGKSYININMEVGNNGKDTIGGIPDGVLATDTALYNNDLAISDSKALGSQHLSSNSALIRNADMFSSNRGMVESIRRVNTLRNVLWNFENDEAEKRNGLDKAGVFRGRRGILNETTQLTQNIGQNVNMSGVVDTTREAVKLSRDFRIPLSDLFGVGSSQWNSNYFGETRIHLELQPNLLQILQLGGSEDTSKFEGQQQDATYGACRDYDATGVTGIRQFRQNEAFGTELNPLITTLTYNDMGLDFPFHVGQAIIVAFTNTGATPMTAPTTPQIITGLEHVTEATKVRLTAAPSSLTNLKIGAVVVTFRQALATAGAAVGLSNVTGILMKAAVSQAAGNTVNINRAELVLAELDTEGPMGMDYTTYSTEEVQGNENLTTLNSQIIVEPNCSNLIVANCGTGLNYSQRPWFQYRIAIDNVDQSGNRDIIYNESIHKNRIERFFKNRNQRMTNSSLTQVACNQPQRAPFAAPGQPGNQAPMFAILESMPITESNKIVNLELEGTSTKPPQDVIFFKELQKSI